jgi:hypothetical protein
MKVLKRILIGVAILIALPLLIALFAENDYYVKREIVVNKPKTEVFSFVKNLRNQERYNKWVMMDPKMKKGYRGIDGQVGFVYTWDGEIAGKGEQEIKSLTDGERVDMQLRFKRPFESVATSSFVTKAVSANQTKISWDMNGRSPYPLNLMNLFIDRVLGDDITTGLNNLKSVLEQR